MTPTVATSLKPREITSVQKNDVALTGIQRTKWERGLELDPGQPRYVIPA